MKWGNYNLYKLFKKIFVFFKEFFIFTNVLSIAVITLLFVYHRGCEAHNQIKDKNLVLDNFSFFSLKEKNKEINPEQATTDEDVLIEEGKKIGKDTSPGISKENPTSQDKETLDIQAKRY